MTAKRTSTTASTPLGLVLNGTLQALLYTIVLVLLVSLLFYFSGLSEASLPTFATAALLLGVFGGATKASRNAGSRGLLLGLAIGVTCFLLLTLLSPLLGGNLGGLSGIASRGVLMLLAGAGGGIVGVTLR